MSVRTVFLLVWGLILAFFVVLGTPLSFALTAGIVSGLLAAGVRWLMLRGRATSAPPRRGTEPLTVTPAPDGWTVIDACPPPLPAMSSVIPGIVGLMAALAVANMGSWRSAVSLLVSALFAGVVTGGILAVWVHGLQNGRRRLAQGPFAVSAHAVRLPSGTEVAAGRIYALTLRNGLDGHVSVMVTNSTIGAASSLGAAHAAAKLARIAYRVDLDHDGRSSTLAGGLTEPQARAVAAEVLRRLPTLA